MQPYPPNAITSWKHLFFTNSVSARRNQNPDPLPDTGFVLLAGQTNASMGACWHPAITFPI